MSFLSKKQEIDLQHFCHDFYDKHILYQADKGVDLIKIHTDSVKKALTEADNVFADIDSEKLKNELTILLFELFALAWVHKFGDKLAVVQSVFTKKYLHEKGRDDIWDGMEKYNGAVSHSVTVGLGDINRNFIIRARMNVADIYIANAEKNGVTIDESIGRAVNRLLSEKAWKNDRTVYFLRQYWGTLVQIQLDIE